jgi:hypothetical protein
MELWPAMRRRVFPIWSRVALTAVVVYLGWTFLGRYLTDQRWKARTRPVATARQADFDRAYGGSELKILQFYARDGVLLEGRQTVICYGVENARAVRVDPPIEALTPSLNRCIEAAPEHNTRYTLTAESAGGQTMSASFEIAVKPDPAELPRITYFRTSKHRVEEGRHVFELVFGQENGELVEIDPPVFPMLHGAPMGKFYVAPRQTTTYTLTVTGKRGHQAKKALTVEIPPA